MKKLKIIVPMILILLVAVGFGVYQYGPNYNFYIIPPSSKRYGKIALSKIDQYGIYANSKRWKNSYAKYLQEISNTQKINQTYPIIERALKTGGGKHSSLITPKESGKTHFKLPVIKKMRHAILYIHEPEFLGSAKQGRRYANLISNELHTKLYRGIIIDLSNNTGGNMDPMIAGFSSLLPDKRLLTLRGRTSKDNTIVKLSDGKLFDANTKVAVNNIKKIKNVPVAVILNNLTASSGELTALSFKVRTRVKYFGDWSAGYTSSNVSVPLFDGSILNITNGGILDGKGQYYMNNKLKPNVLTKHPVKAAKQWIMNQ
ncbi:S41 family peptidase [Secundilactobacillus kimchicus]|uniref:S41 family peptidase n=1 Tax=Secundilactobacillus kimchicus TaxID=528209 RepID=UPI0024A7D3CA|nr:S41 family peptidase [Secundilactobacillus kimchicus]